MITKELVKVERTFEVGDLFLVREKSNGSTYKAGDFILIRRAPVGGDPFYYFTTPGTVNGSISCAYGGPEFLNEMLDRGIISYEGNLK